ncbi:MAG TPA: hypothetical protein VN541_21630 [Tepidisphaeraceae bacterium]|nr:hypothetical protein [Tepidisphaeraceae bacterium]
MRRKLIAIGKSWGIRLPRALVEKWGSDAQLEIRVMGGCLIVAPVGKMPRAGWEESFQKIKAAGENPLLDKEDANTETEWDHTEWTW